MMGFNIIGFKGTMYRKSPYFILFHGRNMQKTHVKTHGKSGEDVPNTNPMNHGNRMNVRMWDVAMCRGYISFTHGLSTAGGAQSCCFKSEDVVPRWKSQEKIGEDDDENVGFHKWDTQ